MADRGQVVPFDPEHSFEIYYIESDPGTALDAEPHQGSAREVVFVKKGKIGITVDETYHVVDSDHFSVSWPIALTGIGIPASTWPLP